MATRHNACVNPALGVDNAGWGGGSVPARAAVSGFGRPFAAQYTSGTFLSTSPGAAAPGLQYTLSAYVRPANAFSSGGGAYIEWRNAANGVISYSNGSYTLSGGGVVVRASITGTAPAGTATAQLILDGVNYSLTTFDATMVLIEQTGSLLDYFDGDSEGASWDGAPGSSSSTLEDAIAAVLAVTLPPLTTALEGAVTVEGVLAAVLPVFTAQLSAVVSVEGALAAVLPAMRAALTGTSDAVPVRPGAMAPRERTGVKAAARARHAARMEGA
ncbi:MAG TPA: hypothetical protein VFV66_28490 [Nonomuraea sp.]|nr:hypothetical protein [Nonomuraea sp.]